MPLFKSAISKPKGFTLIELLIVMGIVGVLVSIGALSYGSAQKYNNNQKRKNDLKTLQLSLEKYYSVNRAYPVVCGWSGAPGAINYGAPCITQQVDYIPGLVPNYIKSLPVDPQHGGCTEYIYYSNGVDYKILAHCPEGPINPNDPFKDVRPNAFQVSTPGGVTW